MKRKLRATQINTDNRPWAIINANGPHGDEFVAWNLSADAAAACLAHMVLQDCAALAHHEGGAS
jgi:hypothetical protein